MQMLIPVDMQLAALAVIVVLGGCCIGLILRRHRSYTELQERFVRAVSVIADFQKLQPELISVLRRIESDRYALRKVVLQVESRLASLKEEIRPSISVAAETQGIERLRDHIDTQQHRLTTILESIRESLLSHPTPAVAESPAVAPPPESPPQLTVTESAITNQSHVPALEPSADNTDHSRFRRAVLSENPELRFSVLKEWISINALAILHRASRGWNTANDLIANIPTYLLPEAALLNESILLIGTRDHSERLALLLRQIDSSSEFSNWFEPASNGSTITRVAAILTRSNGDWKLVAKGINSATAGLPVT
jgi:hypothetical protein